LPPSLDIEKAKSKTKETTNKQTNNIFNSFKNIRHLLLSRFKKRLIIIAPYFSYIQIFKF
jgi:hypothetical protein